MAATEFNGRPVRVVSEAAAWAVLEAVLEKGAARRRGQIVISDWAHLDLKFWVKGGDAIITPPIMRGLLDIQDSILRTRFIAIENNTKLRGLGREERERYEIRAKITSGSSGVDVDLTDVIKHLITELSQHMPPEYVLGLGVFAVLAWTGNSAWRAWLEHRKEISLAEVEAGEKKELIAAQRYATEVDLARWRVFTEAQQRFNGAADIEKAVEKGRLGILQAAASTERAKIANRILLPEVAEELSKKPVASEIRDDLTGLFKVLHVDATTNDGFKVRLEHIESGQKLSASVQDALLSESDKSLIQQGEWSKKPIEAVVRVKMRDSSVTSAVISSVNRVAFEYV